MPIRKVKEQRMVQTYLHICDYCGHQEERETACTSGDVWYCWVCWHAILDWRDVLEREEFLGAVVIDVEFRDYDSREWSGLKIRTKDGKVYELEVELYGDPPYIKMTEAEEED